MIDEIISEAEQKLDSRLFRIEAISAHSSNLGTPVGATGVASWILTVFLAGLALVAAIFLATANYARKETVVGSLTPTSGSVRLIAQRPSVVADVFVTDGASVKAGDAILTLSFDGTVEGGQALGAMLVEASKEEASAVSLQTNARLASLGSQTQELEAKGAGIAADHEQLSASRGLQQQRIALLEQTVAAAQTLFDKQLIAAVQMRQREEALLAARQQLGAIDRELLGLRSQASQLAAQRQRLAADRADLEAQSAQSVARLAEHQAGLLGEQGQILTARTAGLVAALQARPGSSVQSGQTLAVILPEGVGLEAELWLPSRAAGFVKPGDTVRLMYDAFPYQKYGVGHGKVKLIARAPTLPSDLPIPLETRESMYRVVVTLDHQDVLAFGTRWLLAPGARLTADIVLEKRSFFDWLFEPVLAMKARSA